MLDTPPLPEAWAAVSPWTHVRVGWGWRWLPQAWRYHLCVTHAPAPVCNCSMYAIRWGMDPAAEGAEDGDEEEQDPEAGR
jgi:hypothetical protein